MIPPEQVQSPDLDHTLSDEERVWAEKLAKKKLDERAAQSLDNEITINTLPSEDNLDSWLSFWRDRSLTQLIKYIRKPR